MIDMTRAGLKTPLVLGATAPPVRCARRGCLTPDAQPLLVRTEAGWRPLCRVCRARRIATVLKWLRRSPGRAEGRA